MSDHRPETYQMINAWRGLACLWVVLFHVYREQGAFVWASSGQLGVQVFFVISGYCIASAALGVWRRGRCTKDFVIARLRRIYPPMLWSLLFFAAVKVGLSVALARGLIGGEGHQKVDMLEQGPLFYFANLTLTQPLFHTRYLSRVSWSLCYEIAFYAIVAALLFTLRKSTKREGALLGGLHTLTALTLAVLIVQPQWLWYPLDLWPEFGIGVLVFDILHRRTRWWAWLLGAEWVAFLWLRNFRISPVNTFTREGFTTAAVVAVLLVALRPLDSRFVRWPGAKALLALGESSYSIYLIHFLFITTGVRLLPKIPGLRPTGPAAGLLLFVTAVAGGILFYWLFERPGLRRKGPSFVAPPTAQPASLLSS